MSNTIAQCMIVNRGLIIYRVAFPGWRFYWNDYDYRKSGGDRYRIGAEVIIYNVAIGIVWGKPGKNFYGRNKS